MLPFEPLNHEELSPRLAEILPAEASTGVKMAAANGLVPLGTQDLIACFYFLSNDPDPNVRRAARNSLRDLPAEIVKTALQGSLHEKVLHWFAHRRFEDASTYEIILLNRNTADETFAYLAGVVQDERAITLIGQNEDRFIRMPEILESLELNPATPISLINRAKEFFRLQLGISYQEVLAQKRKTLIDDGDEGAGELPEGVVLPEEGDLPPLESDETETHAEPANWRDELPPDFSLMELIKEVFATNEDFEDELLLDPERELSEDVRESLQMKINRMPVLNKLRLAMKGNIEARNILIKNPIRLVQECVLRNPKITMEEIVKLAKDKTQTEEIIRIIASNREWTKAYSVVQALCWNPKTPMNLTTKYLGRLTEKELQKIGKSKQVPGIVAVTARKLATEKQRFN